MPSQWNRRALLASVGAVAAGGCISQPSTDGVEDDLPEGCPISQELDVEWPEELDRSSAQSFVEAYAAEYYREVVIEYEPESQIDSYQLTVGANEAVEEGNGYEVDVNGGGGLYTPHLILKASVTESSTGDEPVPADDVDDTLLQDLLSKAAENPETDPHRRIDPGTEVDRYIDLLDSLSEKFDPLSGPGDSDSVYFRVDETTVELVASGDRFHGDYGWAARYYVDENVLWRVGRDGDPMDGELLECRID